MPHSGRMDVAEFTDEHASAAMSPYFELQYPCWGLDTNGQRHGFTITASQTHRPRVVAGMILGTRLEWQYYIEELQLVLTRTSISRYVDVDDPRREFHAFAQTQPPFGTQRCVRRSSRVA